LARNLSRLSIDFHRRERKEKSLPPFLERGFRSSRYPGYGVINKDPTLARNLSRFFIDFHRRERNEKASLRVWREAFAHQDIPVTG
jgi:hypothetical protein